MDKNSLWFQFLTFVREMKVGDTFTRRDILLKFGGITKRKQVTTMDNYRMLLSNCGYLEYVAAGIYKKKKPVPLMTKKLANDKAYLQTWRSWFLEDVDPK